MKTLCQIVNGSLRLSVDILTVLNICKLIVKSMRWDYFFSIQMKETMHKKL